MKTPIFITICIVWNIFLPIPLFAQEHDSQKEVTLTPTPSPSITTSDSTAAIEISTDTNTNTIGTICDARITTIEKTDDVEEVNDTIDLSAIEPEDCKGPTEATKSAELEINTTNEADIENTVDLTLNTGENAITDSSGEIKTGTAEAVINISNIANTNLIGENAYFSVINIFEPQEGDIILPSEQDFIQDLTEDSNSDINEQITTINNVDLNNQITLIADTGNNNATNIQTGDAEISIHAVEKLNTNIIDSGFLIVEINTFGEWDGELQGWDGETRTNGKTLTAYYLLPQDVVSQPNEQDIQLTNNSKVTNDIYVNASTGNNSVAGERGNITTGDAKIAINMFHMINTNIIGNNWYYQIINIFDYMKGNIIFPRRKIAEVTSTNTNQNPVEEITEAEYINETTYNQEVVVTLTPIYYPTQTFKPSIKPSKKIERYYTPITKQNTINEQNKVQKASSIPSIYVLYMGGIVATILIKYFDN